MISHPYRTLKRTANLTSRYAAAVTNNLQLINYNGRVIFAVCIFSIIGGKCYPALL
jgi:hypothetical protein